MLLLGALCVFAAAIFDFLDGLVARLLSAQSAVGKELDSLADLVSFGVLPGFILFSFIQISQGAYFLTFSETPWPVFALSCVAFLIPLSAALRLARFNVDTEQQHYFKGLPTPAMAILISSIPLIFETQFVRFNYKTPLSDAVFYQTAKLQYWDSFDIWLVQGLQSTYVLVATAVLLTALMNAPIKLIALKFKGLGWAQNQERYLLLLTAAVTVFVSFIHSMFFIKHIPYFEWFCIPIIFAEYFILSIAFQRKMT
jgi:CDP-diacylglycerol--serine O-phosphatidyltransferase